MTDARTLPARLDMVGAGLVALAATLPPEQATMARALFLGAVPDRDDDVRTADADAAAAGSMATILGAFEAAGRDGR